MRVGAARLASLVLVVAGLWSPSSGAAQVASQVADEPPNAPALLAAEGDRLRLSYAGQVILEGDPEEVTAAEFRGVVKRQHGRGSGRTAGQTLVW